MMPMIVVVRNRFACSFARSCLAAMPGAMFGSLASCAISSASLALASSSRKRAILASVGRSGPLFIC